MQYPSSAATRCLVATTAVLLAALASAQPPDGVKRTPRIDGEWWQVAANPDLGVLGSDEQEPVDFGVWQADGTWQLWSCIRKIREPGKTRLFCGWEGPSLTSPDWKPLGSRDPMDFGIESDEDTYVGSLPVAAPELIHHNDQWYIAALRPELDGIRIARLAWEPER